MGGGDEGEGVIRGKHRMVTVNGIKLIDQSIFVIRTSIVLMTEYRNVADNDWYGYAQSNSNKS